MLLFSRQARLSGAPSSLAWAIDVTAKANEHAESTVTLWSGRGGTAFGSIAWSGAVDELAAMERFNAAMAGDAAAVALMEAAPQHVVELMPDTLATIIHGEIGDAAPVGAYLGAVSAVAMPGQLSAAAAWAVSAANTYTEVTGLDVVVTTVVAGAFGQFGWFVRHADAASVEASITATSSSEKYIQLLDSAAGLFQPGAGQLFAQKVA